MIPRLIHNFWAGPNKIPSQLEVYIDQQKTLAGWEYRMWNETDLISHFGRSFVHEHESMPHNVQSDLYRLLIVRDCGGFYLDVDCEILSDFSEFCDGDFFSTIAWWNNERPGVMHSHFGSIANGNMITKMCDHVIDNKQRWISEQALRASGFFMRSFVDTFLTNTSIKDRLVSKSEFEKHIIHHFANTWIDKE